MPRSIDPGTLKVGAGLASANSIESAALVTGTGGLTGLGAHVNDPVDAHDASAVSLADESSSFDGDDVQDGLDELAALVPPRPPSMGKDRNWLPFSGTPDWGKLKLNDAGLIANAYVTSPDPLDPNSDTDLYPYFHSLPTYADGFMVPGNDPATDPTFNVTDGTYTGGGSGDTYQGGFTRGSAIIETARVMPRPGTGKSFCVLSGALYPADRGVLALLYFPPGGLLTGFNSQALNLRCVAALLVGDGMLSGCDGEPGGIFTLGSTTADGYDPYTFPGRATGQYNLDEIHTGVSTTAGPSPTADSAAGMVRQGFDILGATTSADGPTLVGAADNRNTGNFFQYRLPYMKDYSTATGLRYTSAVERPRFFIKPAISLNPGTDLTQAGDLDNFEKDYWTFQVARFRHRFEFPTIAGADARDIGSFVLMHFKTELGFEDLVVNGVAPADGDLYSANMVSWTNVELPANLSTGTGSLDPAPSYPLVRGALIEDDDGDAAISFTAKTHSFQPGSPVNVQVVSGVSYFIPKAQATPWKFTALAGEATNAWDSSYRLSLLSPPVSPGLEGPDTGFLWVGSFARGATFTAPAGTGTVAAGRLRMDMTHLGATDGPFSLAAPPAIADKADFSIGGAGLQPLGDPSEPSFSRDAKVRFFIRRPLGNDDPTKAVYGTTILEASGDVLLFHSTDESLFANPSTATTADAGTMTAAKDVEERFLDEVYRYDIDFPGIAGGMLTGPGMPGVASDIPVPVRAGTTASTGFDTSSWVQLGRHLAALPSDEAQVVGMPDRNPPLSDGVASAMPSSGLLIFPQHDFSAGYRPSLGDGDIGAAQPDYSSETGDRSFVRCFDVGFKNGVPVAAEGTSLVTLKIQGLTLADFAYDPGGPGSTSMAIMIKVPGRTTWLDLGRADGSGPGKQDAVSDGAGCQVVGVNTFDGVDPVTGVVNCTVQAHVGATATFFLGTDSMVPLLVKVIIKDSAGGKALNFEQGGADATVDNLRGLSSIQIVHP